MKPLPFLALALFALSSCQCDPPPDDPPADGAIGSVRADAADGAVTLVLVGLDAPLSAFQVDVVVDGGTATQFLSLADHDIAEAGLVASAANPDGGPKARFTAVVADTRRLPLNSGPLARIALDDDDARVTLTNAFGVDQRGKKRALSVAAP
jgi:hypothetical protein